MVRPGGGGVPGARGRLCTIRSENIDRAGPLLHQDKLILVAIGWAFDGLVSENATTHGAGIWGE